MADVTDRGWGSESVRWRRSPDLWEEVCSVPKEAHESRQSRKAASVRGLTPCGGLASRSTFALSAAAEDLTVEYRLLALLSQNATTGSLYRRGRRRVRSWSCGDPRRDRSVLSPAASAACLDLSLWADLLGPVGGRVYAEQEAVVRTLVREASQARQVYLVGAFLLNLIAALYVKLPAAGHRTRAY